MEHELPEIVEELYQIYGSEQVQRGCPPRTAAIPHGLWAFYQGLLTGVQLRTACLEAP